MATLLDLVDAGQLFRLDPGLDWDEQEWRSLYATPRLRERIENWLPTVGSAWNIQETPQEQFDTLVFEFCSGEPLAIGHSYKALNHLGEGVWELKTADLRLFGWFTTKDCFVGTDLDLKRTIIDLKLYRPYSEQCVRTRTALPLNEPKYIPGEDPHAVVSDWYYP